MFNMWLLDTTSMYYVVRHTIVRQPLPINLCDALLQIHSIPSTLYNYNKMELKFAHIIVFLLLAFSFETFNAQSEGLEFIKLLKELKYVHESKPNLECQGKLRWPELIGVPAQYAKGIIEKENKFISHVQIILNGSPVTADFSCNRVRIAVNILDYAVSMPVVG